MKSLTPRQQQIFDFLAAFQERHGRTPTGPEIADEFGYSDPSPAYQHLRLIARKGYLSIVQPGHRKPLRIRLNERYTQSVAHHWPRFGTIPAGPVSHVLAEAPEHVRDVEDLLPMIRRGDFFLTVEGDSMVDAGLEEGTTVLMRPADAAPQGDICAVWVEGEGGTLKRVFSDGDTVRLVPENAAYTPRTYPADQVRIQGVLIAALAVHTFKHRRA